MIEAETLACSEACAGEPLAGTASEATLFAALAWPKARWHADKPALSEGLPPAVGELGRAAKRAGKQLQLRLFDRGAAAASEGVEVVCADFAAGRTLAARANDAEGAAALMAAFVAGETAGPPLAAPLVLVCTDGKHDRCCGKLGRSLFAALRGRLDVAEASHLGGHRLAPNCLALPSGRLYGRVGANDVGGLVDAILHDRVYLPCYRGRSGLAELAQVAEAAALARFPGARGAELSSDGKRVRVALSDGELERRLEVECAQEEHLGIGSCGDAEPERRVRWRAAAVRVV
ncbi:MAG TPA: sucrase ferredoxin [Myxococcota bacterium]|nr:sucrase ferredoxin [Myxococcota bacterium]